MEATILQDLLNLAQIRMNIIPKKLFESNEILDFKTFLGETRLVNGKIDWLTEFKLIQLLKRCWENIKNANMAIELEEAHLTIVAIGNTILQLHKEKGVKKYAKH